ncbi:MAG: acetylglutamate kinase [Bacteroidota bacterium]|nr:acetylglutamate kinase [Candidatus Kapabacteria bacterium]MDW8219091.1 acetylglutamate kinase [Bacteroidota bacterium]
MRAVVTVKVGGNVLDDDTLCSLLLDSLASLGLPWILVHGGGKCATELSTRLGIQTNMIDGRRITDAATLDIVTMVYAGLINKRLVAGLQARGINALGVTGADANLICARKRQHPTLDYGFVGDIARVDVERLLAMLHTKLYPVIAPLTHDGRGTLLNTNADTIASELASSLATALGNSVPVHLIYCFEQPGVLRTLDDSTSVIGLLTNKEYEELKRSGNITRGMIPKLDNAFAALRRGVTSVNIAHARALSSFTTTPSIGTTLTLA